MFIERHHIVFKSQGGLDFDINFVYLEAERHRGNLGPHLCEKTDTILKKQMEINLREILTKRYYYIEELIEVLGLNSEQANKAFKKVKYDGNGIAREDVLRRLMGGKLVL